MMFRFLVVAQDHFQGIDRFRRTSRVFRRLMVHRFQVLRIQFDVRSRHADCAASAHGTNSALVGAHPEASSALSDPPGRSDIGLNLIGSIRLDRDSMNFTFQHVAERGLDVLDEGCCRCGHLTCDRIRALDLVLQLDDAVEQRFSGGRAARHVDIDRHDAVAAAHHRVRVVIVAAPVGT